MPQTRDPERTRSAILEAAAAIFAEHGYGAASLQAIAGRAGVSRATPSYFFGSKKGLYRAVLEHAFVDIRERIEKAQARARPNAVGPAEAIGAGIEAYFDFLVAHPTFVRLVQWEALNGGRVLREVAPRLMLVREQLAVLGAALERDDSDPLDPTYLLISTIALCWFPIAHADTLLATLGLDPRDPEFIDRYRRHVRALVLRGITG